MQQEVFLQPLILKLYWVNDFIPSRNNHQNNCIILFSFLCLCAGDSQWPEALCLLVFSVCPFLLNTIYHPEGISSNLLQCSFGLKVKLRLCWLKVKVTVNVMDQEHSITLHPAQTFTRTHWWPSIWGSKVKVTVTSNNSCFASWTTYLKERFKIVFSNSTHMFS